ncbi:MAG: UDP-N-acetylmuramoyl-tripeptide--D-alanyl-D-alanine ligase [Enterococcus sp.]
MNLTIKEIANALKLTEINDERQVSGMEFDSRNLSSNSLFVPLAGTRDGHEFIAAAIEKGAIATLWSRPIEEAPENIVVLPVTDVLAAFQELAKYYLKKVAPKVVGITGSNGKTTTKDMTEAVLAQKYQTYKTQGNYNNEIGVPYTIVHMPADCELLILEMGMDHAGDIELLSNLAQPDAAAVTIVGEAHIEYLGSRENIAKAKLEIASGLKPEGLLVVPANETLVTPLVAEYPQTITTFGIETGDVAAKILSQDRTQTTFTVANAEFTIPVLGAYNVTNALIAYTFGQHFGLSIAEIQKGLATFELTKNRTEWLKAQNGADLLSDVYNANPTAMGLVLDTFAKLTTPGRKMAVLADMLELGTVSKEMHASMAEHLTDEYAIVYLYGQEMTALFHTLTEKQSNLTVIHFEKANKAALIKMLQSELQPTDSLVLKGSNGMGLAEVVKSLQNY